MIRLRVPAELPSNIRTPPSPLHRSLLPRSLVMLSVGCAGLLAGACGGDDRTVPLPSTKAPGAPSSAASTRSPEDAVKHAYTQYWAVLPQAEQADSEQRRRELLAQYASEPQLSTALRGINDLHGRDLTSSGFVVVHVRDVRVEGATATVWDCQDATKALIHKRSTGQTISRGVPNDYIRATLSRGTDGQWRISRFSPLERC